MSIEGTYTITQASAKRLYTLQSDQLHPGIFLIVMDDNVLHFADANMELLTGNGGWGYVLNKAKQ